MTRSSLSVSLAGNAKNLWFQ